MGGIGSGRPKGWKRWQVEECYTLSAFELAQHGAFDDSTKVVIGQKVWANPATMESLLKMKFGVTRCRRMILGYTLFIDAEAIPVKMWIDLDVTRPNYGGKRYWFRCPFCARRVATMHLPPKQTKFACRKCYDLTYKSCQQWYVPVMQTCSLDEGYYKLRRLLKMYDCWPKDG